MTNEDMRRNMEFIVEHQARFAAHLEQLEEERVRDRPRLASLEKSFQRVVELLAIQESRIDRVEFKASSLGSRSGVLETNMAALLAAQAHADERLSALINMVMDDRGRLS